jgi:hypothetical protein
MLAPGRGDAPPGRYLSMDYDVVELREGASDVQRDDQYTLPISELAESGGTPARRPRLDRPASLEGVTVRGASPVR